NNYEGATHSTLIMSAPGMKAAGQKCNAVVELADIYPSLIELAGLATPRKEQLEGQSLVPLLNDATAKRTKPAFSQYPKRQYLGTAMRTDRYRYVEWQDPKTGAIAARELYDYQADANESENVADKPENAALIAELGRQRKEMARGEKRKT